MKNRRYPALLLVVLALFAGGVARAQAEISFSFFQESLEPYGEWIEVGDYGTCWRPTGVAADWAPYTDGYWTYTDAGWTWVSYEDWGSVCYHYGRWVSVEDEGWCWVPDYEWGPAWVSWRQSDDYIGWAPLPPEARWERDTGFSVWVDTTYDIGPGYYRFCDVRDFGAPVIREVCLPPSRNLTIIHNTINITNISYNTHRDVIFNGGPRYSAIAARSRRPIPALKLVRNKNVNIVNNTTIEKTVNRGGRGRRPLPTARQRGNQLEVFAPDVRRPSGEEAIKVKAHKVVSKDKVNKGWAGVKDPDQRAKLKDKMRQEARGLTRETAPAKPVEVADLQAVPVTGDPDAPSPVATASSKRGRRGAEPGVAKPDGDSKPGDATASTGSAARARKDREPALGRRAPDAAPSGTADAGEPQTNEEREERNRQKNAKRGESSTASSSADDAVKDAKERPGQRSRGKADVVAVPAPVASDPVQAEPNTNGRDKNVSNDRPKRGGGVADQNRRVPDTIREGTRERALDQNRANAAAANEAAAVQRDRAEAGERRRLQAERAEVQSRRAAQDADRQNAAAAQMRREQQASQALAAQRRQQQQLESNRSQIRQQQFDSRRGAQQDRPVEPRRSIQQQPRAAAPQRFQQQPQRQVQVERQPQRAPAGGGGGQGRGRGQRQLSAEEAKALQRR